MKKLVCLLPLVGMGFLAGCPAFPELCDYGACGDGGTSADGSTSPEATAPDTGGPDGNVPGCDTPTEPLRNPEKCLVDAFGLFVSPTGDDANPGTKSRPLKSIGKALGTTSGRIVVCEGEYGGSLDVTRGVEIYGGVACDFAKAGGKAKVVASKPAYAVVVKGVDANVVLADLEITGINAVAAGESSVGLFVSQSANVRVVRSKVDAGDGADAPAKRDGNFTYPADALLKGGNADDKGTGGFGDDTPGAAGASGACPGGGTSSGGKGGIPGGQGDNANPMPPGAARGEIAACGAGGSGGDGAPGMPGSGRPGASSHGAIAAAGYAGAPGENGGSGTPGGGGGGGYGTAGAGGGGAGGGCGGQGGFGGGAGGSSIALVSFTSTVALEGVTLTAKTAKVGGIGGAGQIGQSGGTGGNRSGAACNGGNGNKGGDGGNGGGGAGGIAVGIAWVGGKEPSRDATTTITRPTGAPAAGGEGGGAGATKGADGVHADVLEVK